MRIIKFNELSKSIALIGFVLLTNVGDTWAVTMATKEQVLCAYDNIVKATVVDANVTRCYTTDDKGNCIYSADSIDVILKVDDVIANKGSTKIAGAIVITPRIGDLYRGTVGDNIPLPESIVRERSDENLKLILEHRYPPSKSEVELTKKADVRDYFLGKQFIFGLIFMDKSSPMFFSIAWRLDESSWIVDELSKEHPYACAKLL